MSVERSTITTLDALERLRPAWNELLDRSDASEPTTSPEWLLPWWRIYGAEGDRALCALAFHEGGRLVGLAPLLRRTAVRHRVIPLRRLEPLASGEDEYEETCSDYLAPIAERGRERQVARGVAQALGLGALGEWDELVWPSMRAEATITRELAAALEDAGASVELHATASSPFVPLPSTWEAYLAALPSPRRYAVRRALRDFEKWTGEPPALDVVARAEDVIGAFERLVALHEARWEDEGGAFASPRFRAFHRAAATGLFARDALDIGCLRAGPRESRRPIAAFYNFRWAGRSYFYQSGRALDVPKGLGVGIVMHALGIRLAIERGLREYDFLAGTSRYKTDLALDVHGVVTLRAARPRLLEHALRGARRLRDAFREATSESP